MFSTIRVSRKFCASHKLSDYIGNCAELHGHTWKVVVEICGKVKPSGLVIDVRKVKELIDGLGLDHCDLNQKLQMKNPSMEYVCAWVFEQIKPKLEELTLKLLAVEVWESEDCCARLAI